jgi:hypothetical protein
MSTTISLAIFDQYENEIPIYATDIQPIEFFIPRDSNLILPDMKLQNVTSKSSEELFYLDLNQFLTNKNLTISLHFELRPLNINLGYLFIYKFDKPPQLNDTDNYFCPDSEFFLLFKINTYDYYYYRFIE